MRSDDSKVPLVGVGCIVTRGTQLLLVRGHRGYWAPPGGHLDFGETPEQCAARETLEETGLQVENVRFVAVTNDLIPETNRHYVTIWMRADAPFGAATVNDAEEIAELGWFERDALPSPRHVFFDNLLAGRCYPAPGRTDPVGRV
jgi:8-oxo-dGTP diphosphatase